MKLPPANRVILVCGLLAFGLQPQFSSAAAPRPTVILLSWDGVRHDALERFVLPNLRRLANGGVRGDLLSVMPSKTFPAHVSLATGVSPHTHGIIDNYFFDRVRGWYRMADAADWLDAEPLWITAQRQGVETATYFWVGSERDWRGQRQRYREAPFDADRTEAVKVDRILEWLALPPAKRPQLIMGYFRGGDAAGHRYGPLASEVGEALVTQDAELGRLIDGIETGLGWEQVTLLIVSDHGMTEAGEYVPVAETLAAAGIDAVVSGSTLGHVFLNDPAQAPEAARLIRELDSRIEVYRSDAAPQSWALSHPDRTGDLVLAVPAPLVLWMADGLQGMVTRTLWRLGRRFGGHGYDPLTPDMKALMLAYGRGTAGRAGEHLKDVDPLRVVPTVCRLLAIEPSAAATAVPFLTPPIPAAVQSPSSAR
ncbi:MAG: ectonucleotide pyrophosphatase/phosphodiesterase [Pseudomonadota bacterium]